MQLLQILSLECSCCKCYIPSKESMESLTSAILFGAVKYAICPLCGGEIEKENWTNSYKRNWEKWANKLWG